MQMLCYATKDKMEDNSGWNSAVEMASHLSKAAAGFFSLSLAMF